MKNFVSIVCVLLITGCSGTLHQAIRSKDTKKAQALIAETNEINLQDKQGQTPLHISVRSKSLKIAEALLKAGADPRIADNSGLTPLHLSASYGYDDISLALLKAGAKLSAETRKGNTPVDLAIRNGHLNSIKLFCQKSNQIDFANSTATTALHIAAETGDSKIVAYLVENGADINAKNQFSRSPLHCALYSDHDAIAKYLYDHGAKAEMVGRNANDIYATAKAYKLFGDVDLEKNDSQSAVVSYRIAMDYYEKASIHFKGIAEDLGKKATRRKWKNALSYIGAMAQAYSSASTSVSGYGVGVYRVSTATTFEELAAKFKTKSENCHISALECFEMLACLKRASSNQTAAQCANDRTDADKAALIGSQAEKAFFQSREANFTAYSQSQPYKKYIADIVAGSENNAMFRFLIPTYEAMLKGFYNDLEDANVEMARRSSPEMFVRGWLNTPLFIAKYNPLSQNNLFEDNEFLVAITKESLLTNKTLYIFEKDHASIIIHLADIENIEQKIGLVSVTTIFELSSGKSVSTEKAIPKPIYIEAVRAKW